MQQKEIKFIPKNEINSILPLLMKLNKKTPKEVLKKRLVEMCDQNYKCVGVFIDDQLIGIAGLWFLTRHYCGRTIEPDHVIIDSSFRNKGLGKELFDWIHNYALENGCEATELNTFIHNTKSHRFYEDLNYKKLGYHYLNIF